MSAPLTRKEERELQQILATGREPHCPRCGHIMDVTEIPPRPQVSYVRHRAILHCPNCKLKGAVDLKARQPP